MKAPILCIAEIVALPHSIDDFPRSLEVKSDMIHGSILEKRISILHRKRDKGESICRSRKEHVEQVLEKTRQK